MSKPEKKSLEKLAYSRKEAVEATSLSLRTIDYMIADKTLRVKRVRSRVVIPAASLRAIMRDYSPNGAR